MINKVDSLIIRRIRRVTEVYQVFDSGGNKPAYWDRVLPSSKIAELPVHNATEETITEQFRELTDAEKALYSPIFNAPSTR